MTKRSKKQEVAVVETIELTGEELAAIESIETEAETQSVVAEAEEVQAPTGTEEPQPTFMEALDAIARDVDAIDATRGKLIAAFNERKAFERAKNASNENIQKTLDKGLAKIAPNESVGVLLAACVSPDFVMRSTNEGSAYNVYGVLKLADLTKALVSGVIGNDVNRHIVKSLFQVIAAGEQFTAEAARACVSKQIRFTEKVVKYLSRHTASPTTAPTQVSSTMAALTSLGIVKNTGTVRNPVWSLTDAPIVERMKEIAQAA